MTVERFANFTSVERDPGVFAAWAEAAGFDGVTCADHFFRRHAYPHVWVTLAAMAAATRRVTLASAYANNLFRSPVEFAQAALALQRLSGGRFEAGLGAGWLADELHRAGLDWPPGPARARRYREAITIVKDLLTMGRCTFDGDHYRVDVPVIGPTASTPIPLVASLGGPWTIANIAPLVDRVEIKFGRSTRDGDLDLAALASVTSAELDDMVGAIRAVNADVPIGLFVMFAAGSGPDVGRFAGAFGTGIAGEFVGEPAKVAEAIARLESHGISRVQLAELTPGSFEALVPALG